MYKKITSRKIVIFSIIMIYLPLLPQNTIAKSKSNSKTTIERDWISWRGPFGNGSTDEVIPNPKALEDSSSIRWKTNIGLGSSSVAVQGKRIYVFGNQKCAINSEQKDCDVIACLNAETGKEIWRYVYPSDPGPHSGPFSSPVVNDDFVYAFSRHGNLLCLNKKDGKKIWETDINSFGFTKDNWGYASSPVIHDNTLFLRTGKSGIALHKKTGEKIWADDTTRSKCYSSAAISQLNGKPVIAFAGMDAVRLFDIGTKQLIHQYPCKLHPNGPSGDPQFLNKDLLLINGSKLFGLLDISQKPVKPAWIKEDYGCGFQGFIIFKNMAFGMGSVISRDQAFSIIRCINLDNGNIEWRKTLGIWGSFSLAGDKLIVIEGNGRLVLVNPSMAEYLEIASMQVFNYDENEVKGGKTSIWTQPVFSHGHIYIRATNGDLACVDMR